MKSYRSYFRKEIDAMKGYVPGEQPKVPNLIKLNTNENPFPPSPGVLNALKNLEGERLRLYPDPTADELRTVIAGSFGLMRENVIAGNGSDDILNIAIRCFASSEFPVVCLTPSYSLYPSLSEIQGASCIQIGLKPDFSLPDDLLEQAKKANLLIIARPNAPTGNLFPKERMIELCENFNGIVLIDEAYADFSSDNCADLVQSFPNLIISRTFSKSRSLAGLRFGYALANKNIIEGMMKVKDSYNVSFLTQRLALASLQDNDYFLDCVNQVKWWREILTSNLREIGFKTTESETNFVFASPPGGDGEKYFKVLRENNILVRYFPGPETGKYARITIGTPDEMTALIELTRKLFNN